MSLLAAEKKDWQGAAVPRAADLRTKRELRTVIGFEECDCSRSKMKKKLGLGPGNVPTLFIGKWTVKIISSLQERPHRHGQLRRQLRDISQRMLTRTLRNLESAGLIVRRVDKSKSIAVEYSLTELGRTFVAPLNSICSWARDHHKELSATVRLLQRHKKHS